MANWDEENPGWDDGIFYKDSDDVGEWFGALQDANVPDPSEWSSYDVYLNDDGVIVDITDADGRIWTYDAFEGDLNADTMADWDWVYDIWDWLDDHYPDVDKDSKYENA